MDNRLKYVYNGGEKTHIVSLIQRNINKPETTLCIDGHEIGAFDIVSLARKMVEFRQGELK